MFDRRDFIKTAGAAIIATAFDSFAAQAKSVDSLCYASVDELIALFKSKKASPVDLLNAQIKQIEAFNPKVNCITYTHFDEAMAQAKESEARYLRGNPRPLEGITVAIKDEFARPGWKVSQGSLIFKDAPPTTENSPIVDYLDAAGAVLPIQTTVPEFWYFVTASTRAWGTTHNPWNLEYSAGGSSTGSAAAIASGFTTLATGSDMGGSIRLPASQCGLYGFRPTFGRVPSGEVPYSTAGPLARTFGDMVHFQNAITGPSDKIMAGIRPKLDFPYRYPNISKWRIAVDWGYNLGELSPAVRQAMQRSIDLLRSAGCIVDEVDCGFKKEQKYTFMRGLFATSIGQLSNIANAHRDLLSPYMAEAIDTVGPSGPQQADEAETLTEQLHRQVQERVFGKGYKVLLMPTLTTPLYGADLFKSKQNNVELFEAVGLKQAMTWVWNMLNRYPVLDVPLGIAEDRMPTGMQVIGQTFSDLDPFQFASSYSRLATPLFADGRFPTFSY